MSSPDGIAKRWSIAKRLIGDSIPKYDDDTPPKIATMLRTYQITADLGLFIKDWTVDIRQNPPLVLP